MKNNVKKRIGAALCSMAIAVSASISAGATTVRATSSGHSFDKAWEAYASGANYSMVYGFNTAWINEDYTWTRHNTTSHTAIVKNGKGQYSANASKKSWAKIEVTHNGSSITYKMVY
ncbi:MAG: hypothetical protein IJJ76_00510 [Ruminococcus sp.]|uniref:mediterrocin family bacteriocin n=1 Tax=Ruminococcus sp. TaxID=41978 RepID=UPI0025F97DB2|nr:hypothetical protein [Ruminococcus sp.]MBQ9543156.1 hypothetical protein [Ruminococcus sp.]MBR0528232.1 hypothetical protein [Ruminococcus sp.]